MNLLKSFVSVDVVTASLLVATWVAASQVGAHAASQDVASLYAPQPPADAPMLRVVNLASQTAYVTLPGSAGAVTVEPGAATRFSVLTEGTPQHVAVDGLTVMNVPGSRSKAGRNAGARDAAASAGAVAITVALERDARGWRATSVTGGRERIDGLKATLHALNFVKGCAARITVDGNGPAVFPQIESGVQQDRAVNPVTATLVGSCGAASSQALALPPLAAGDSYTLFLSGDPAKPVLTGIRDTVAWPPARN